MIDVPILVKDALKDGRRKKNYRILVLNDDGTTDFVIDNNTLVSEQADIDERMCSGDTIKFGLCEGSSFQFQYFDHPNITGRQIQVFIDAQYIGTGYENVQKFQRYRVITLEEGGNYRAYSANQDGFNMLYLIRNGTTQQLTPTSTDTETYVEFEGMVGDKLEVEWTQFPLYDTYLQKQNSDMLLEYPIPMGFFTVKNCSRQASTGIIKATGYNKLQSDYLDNKANDLLIEAYNSIDRTYDPNPTIDDVLRIALGAYAIDVNEPLGSTWSDEVIYFDYYDPTWGTTTEIVKVIGTFETTKKVPTHYEADGSGYKIYADGGVRIKVSGLNILREYYDTHNVPLYNRFGYAQFYIQIAYGNGSDTWAINEHSEDIYETPYIKNYRVFAPTPVIPPQLPEDEYPISFKISMPIFNGASHTPEQEQQAKEVFDALVSQLNVEILYTPPTALGETPASDIEDWEDVTLRELQSAVFETACQFGQLDRETDLFAGYELNGSRLLPQDTLYPDNALYPNGGDLSGFKSMYSKLWADEGNVHKWRYLIITYKGLDGEGKEKEYTLQRTINNDGTDNYNCSDNWLFRNLVWTAEQIGEYADEMVSKMRDMTWFPFEMWCAGLPYIETGDEIEISINQQTYTSYVLQRQLKGIQNLQDTFINGTLDIF